MGYLEWGQVFHLPALYIPDKLTDKTDKMRNEKGQFIKGNKAGGRKSGSENLATKEVREYFNMLIKDRYDQLAEDLDRLKPRDRWEVIIRLSQFVLPKLQQVEYSDVSMPEHIRDLMSMDEETLKRIYNV